LTVCAILQNVNINYTQIRSISNYVYSKVVIKCLVLQILAVDRN